MSRVRIPSPASRKPRKSGFFCFQGDNKEVQESGRSQVGSRANKKRRPEGRPFSTTRASNCSSLHGDVLDLPAGVTDLLRIGHAHAVVERMRAEQNRGL